MLIGSGDKVIISREFREYFEEHAPYDGINKYSIYSEYEVMDIESNYVNLKAIPGNGNGADGLPFDNINRALATGFWLGSDSIFDFISLVDSSSGSSDSVKCPKCSSYNTYWTYGIIKCNACWHTW